MNLMRGYFKHGGMQSQFNVTCREVLEAAREKPKDYKDLMVRVAEMCIRDRTGYEEAVKETARLTEEKKELSQDARAELDQKLAKLWGDLKQTEAISICYFSEDEKKAGGAYLTKTGKVKTIDRYRRELVWADGSRIRLDDIVEVSACSGQELSLIHIYADCCKEECIVDVFENSSRNC